MHGKRASLIVNLRSGHTVLKVPEMVAALNAAGWKTDICLKEYSGETLQLAEQAARDGHDLVISYGGDGTLNAVVNGVLYAGGKSIIGDIPGGTFNEWAGETNIPRDPVKAALALVDSVAARCLKNRPTKSHSSKQRSSESRERRNLPPSNKSISRPGRLDGPGRDFPNGSRTYKNTDARSPWSTLPPILTIPIRISSRVPTGQRMMLRSNPPPSASMSIRSFSIPRASRSPP
jgi:hypothetical protein